MINQTCPDCGKTFHDCAENGCDYASVDPTVTRINIGTNHGNLPGIEISKPFEDLTGSDVLEIAKQFIKKRPITIYGWAPSITRAFRRNAIILAVLTAFILGSCNGTRYVSKTQRDRVKTSLRQSYPKRIDRPHTFILFKPIDF